MARNAKHASVLICTPDSGLRDTLSQDLANCFANVSVTVSLERLDQQFPDCSFDLVVADRDLATSQAVPFDGPFLQGIPVVLTSSWQSAGVVFETIHQTSYLCLKATCLQQVLPIVFEQLTQTLHPSNPATFAVPNSHSMFPTLEFPGHSTSIHTLY